MKRLSIALLAVTLTACQHLQGALTVLQDPATQRLISDLTAIVGLITQLQATPANTPEAQAALQANVEQQIDAALALITELRNSGAARQADRFQSSLEELAGPLGPPPLEPV